MTPKASVAKAIFLCFALCILVMPVLAYAQADALQKVATDKINDIKNIIYAVGGVVVAIGVSIGGIKMALGHPDAWGFASKVLIGGILIACSGKIVTWLGVGGTAP